MIEAFDRLQARVAIDAISSIYETEPWGYADQPRFLNAACGGRDRSVAAKNCWSVVKAIEMEMGREPTFRYGPRAIDIDILLYGDAIIDQADHFTCRTRICTSAILCWRR